MFSLGCQSLTEHWIDRKTTLGLAVWDTDDGRSSEGQLWSKSDLGQDWLHICKMKTRAPGSTRMKNVKRTTAEHDTNRRAPSHEAGPARGVKLLSRWVPVGTALICLSLSFLA